MKIGIILGTRPEIIKLFPIINYCKRNNVNFIVIHTNQHYSYELDSQFFEELNLPSADYNLNIGSGTHGKQTGKMLEKIEEILFKEKPDVVLVQGDTNTVLAGALAASKLNISVGHVEAGLRSYDRNMPEETNRIITDHISNFLFCPTENQKKILISENIDKEKIHVVGNTICDAVYLLSANSSNILNSLDIKSKEYYLLTLHRSENVDNKNRLKYLLQKLNQLNNHASKIIFPIHPRTKSRLIQFELELPNNVVTINPVNYQDMITLQKNAKIILTDSGGIQEEACILGTPTVTLRTTTERPETITVGANMLMSDNLLHDVKIMSNKDGNWKNPFGLGTSSEAIIKILKNKLS